MGYNLLVALERGFRKMVPFSFGSDPGGELHPEAETPGYGDELALEEVQSTLGAFPPNKRCWIIDPGHGPRTQGKRSPLLPDGRQFLEYKFTRDVTKHLARLLQERRFSFALTVDLYDRTVGNDLQKRTNFENNYPSEFPKAFVSIHSNAARVPNPAVDWGDASGIETWHYFRPGNADHQGKAFAGIFQKHLVQALRLRDRGLKYTDSTKINPETGRPFTQLWVLRETFSPAVLLEVGFYNNLEEVKFLLKPDTPEIVAMAIVGAMEEIENNISLR